MNISHSHINEWVRTGDIQSLQRYKEQCVNLLCYLHYEEAAVHGQLDVIKWMQSQNISFIDKDDASRICSGAAFGGHLDILQYLYANGFPVDKSACNSAARGGHIDCLEFAREKGCEWNASTCAEACIGDQVECLKYLRLNGCPWNLFTLYWAATSGSLECLKYAFENGCPTDYDGIMILSKAAQYGNLDCLLYAHQVMGCRLSYEAASSAAQFGHLHCLRYLLENGCPKDTMDFLHLTAKYDHMDCFTYIFQSDLSKCSDCWSKQFPYGYNQSFVDQFDLEDWFWRTTLFDIDLSSHPLFQEKVKNKKIEISTRQDMCFHAVKDYLSKDVIKYIVYEYI